MDKFVINEIKKEYDTTTLISYRFGRNFLHLCFQEGNSITGGNILMASFIRRLPNEYKQECIRRYLKGK